MGLFGGNSDQSTRRRNPDMVFGFRALAAGYMLYMLYEIVQMYIKGESGDLAILITGIVVLGGGALWIFISSFISWRREKAALAEEEAEAAQEEADDDVSDGEEEE